MEWNFPQTPFHDWVAIQMEGDGIVMQRGTNVNAQSVVRPPIRGKRNSVIWNFQRHPLQPVRQRVLFVEYW